MVAYPCCALRCALPLSKISNSTQQMLQKNAQGCFSMAALCRRKREAAQQQQQATSAALLLCLINMYEISACRNARK